MLQTLSRLAIAAILVAFPVAAEAHSHLKSSDPAAGAQVASPAELKLTFSMPIVAKFSGVKLKDAAGQEVTLGDTARDSNDNHILIVKVPAVLKPGTYTVDWHVVAIDSHRMTGSYAFKVTS